MMKGNFLFVITVRNLGIDRVSVISYMGILEMEMVWEILEWKYLCLFWK